MRTFPTFLTAFLIPLNILEKKPNSMSPVSGLKLFSAEPTTYRSGSSIPASRKCWNIDSFRAGLWSINLRGTINSPVSTWTTRSSPNRPYEAILAAMFSNSAIPLSPNSFRVFCLSSVAKSSSDMTKSPIPPEGTSS